MPSKQVVCREKKTIIDVNVSQPRSVREIKVDSFNFNDAICISVDGALYAFRLDREYDWIRVFKFENFQED